MMLASTVLRDMVRIAANGNQKTMDELKIMFPRRDLRRKHCDIYGTVIMWRGKGSKGRWWRL